MYPKRLLIQKRRNEYGRKIRKQYESKQTNATRNEVVDYTIIENKWTGTITTVQTDNMLLIIDSTNTQEE